MGCRGEKEGKDASESFISLPRAVGPTIFYIHSQDKSGHLVTVQVQSEFGQMHTKSGVFEPLLRGEQSIHWPAFDSMSVACGMEDM